MRNIRIPFTGLFPSGEIKNAQRDSIQSNKNIFQLVSISAKLLLDASLRDSDPELLQNKLLINFIASLFYSLNDGKEDSERCLLDIIYNEDKPCSNRFNQILTTIQCIESLKYSRTAQSRLLAFICLCLNAKNLIENVNFLISNKKKLLQYYSQNSFIFTDEMRLMLEFIDPINCTDFTIDIVSMDFDDNVIKFKNTKIFLKIDIGFLFNTQMRLPLRDDEYPKLVIPDTLVMLKNQNVCLEQQYFETMYNDIKNNTGKSTIH
ncbi:hypothetical protein MXB_2768 [Myxobolus squamalis]|nr:hypothetical protein MXB_2768 [Myxobolus squamalis]